MVAEQSLSLFCPLLCYLVYKLHIIISVMPLFLERKWLLVTSLWQLLLNTNILPTVGYKSIFLIFEIKYVSLIFLFCKAKEYSLQFDITTVSTPRQWIHCTLSNLWKFGQSCFQHYSSYPHKINTLLCNCWDFSLCLWLEYLDNW